MYGTLLISACGDVGAAGDVGSAGDVGAAAQNHGEALRQALHAVGLDVKPGASGNSDDHLADAPDCLAASIEQSHQMSRAAGIAHPEVDILAIWRRTLDRLRTQGCLASLGEPLDLRQLALEYEVRANPTWPMPGAAECLSGLARRRITTGLISNAQFFTADLFPALFGRTAEQLGVDGQLQFFSYRYGWAKPGLRLFELAAAALSQRSIPTGKVLYIGNDLLNDVWGASRVGFRTALFAGDARSLRTREGDPRVAGVKPDLVVTELAQVLDCVVAGETGNEQG